MGLKVVATTVITSFSLASAFLTTSHGQKQGISSPTCLYAATLDNSVGAEKCFDNKFDLDTALFCGGLAFDAYVEPPADSSRWEKGVS